HSGTSVAEATTALIQFLTAPAAAQIIKKHGLEPGCTSVDFGKTIDAGREHGSGLCKIRDIPVARGGRDRLDRACAAQDLSRHVHARGAAGEEWHHAPARLAALPPLAGWWYLHSAWLVQPSVGSLPALLPGCRGVDQMARGLALFELRRRL